MSKRLYTDEDVRELAKQLIKDIAGRLKLDPKILVRETEEGIEFVIPTSNNTASICFSPQKRVEEIIREVEEWTLQEDVPPEEYNFDINGQIIYSADCIEVEILIGDFLKLFDVPYRKLEDATNKLFEQAKKAQSRIAREVLTPIENEKQCKELTRITDKVKPLWDYIIEHFEENDYRDECKYVIRESKFLELAGDISIPENLLKQVFKRKDISNNHKPTLEPLGFALQHAKQEMNLADKYESLKRKYYDGQKLIKEENEFMAEINKQS